MITQLPPQVYNLFFSTRYTYLTSVDWVDSNLIRLNTYSVRGFVLQCHVTRLNFCFFKYTSCRYKKWLSLWDSPPEYSYRFKTLRPYTCQRAGKKPEKEMKRNPQKMGEWEKPALRRLSAYNTPGSYVRCFPGAVIATESDQKWNLFAPNSFWGRICVSLSLLFRTRIFKRNII